MTCYCPVPRNSQAHVQPIMGSCNCYGGVYECLQTSVQHDAESMTCPQMTQYCPVPRNSSTRVRHNFEHIMGSY